MPIYEYQCNNCGHKFDEIQKHDAAPLVDCPDCEAPGLIKLISAPIFRLKGKGWYETDFKQDNRRNLADDNKSDKKADTAKGKETTTGGKSAEAKSSGTKSDGASKAADSTAKKAPQKKASGSD